MTRRARRAIVALALASTAGTIGLGACGFPDVQFADELFEGGNGTDASGEGAALDGNAGGDALDGGAPVNPDVDPEGGAKDASSAGDAAQVDAAGCTTCDCDNDGFNRVELGKGCDGGPAGKQPDCDDLNPAIHPGLGFIDDVWPSSTKHTPVGDWDCSGETTKQLPYDGACELLTACATGFVGNPPCGGTADYLTCNQEVLPIVGLTCSQKSKEAPGKRTQGCH